MKIIIFALLFLCCSRPPVSAPVPVITFEVGPVYTRVIMRNGPNYLTTRADNKRLSIFLDSLFANDTTMLIKVNFLNGKDEK